MGCWRARRYLTTQKAMSSFWSESILMGFVQGSKSTLHRNDSNFQYIVEWLNTGLTGSVGEALERPPVEDARNTQNERGNIFQVQCLVTQNF